MTYRTGTGDFNGDGLSDWFSNGWVSYSSGSGFQSKHIVPTPAAARSEKGWENIWFWPITNASAAADFNGDGFDDLICSNMPMLDDGTMNGGDLYLIFGSADGLLDGVNVKQIQRSVDVSKNIGTNFMVAADFNGDGTQHLLLVEHAWTEYYA